MTVQEISRILLLILMPLFIVDFCLADTLPFYATIDSVINKPDCLLIREFGISIEIVNHCQTEFLFFDLEGNLDLMHVLVNREKWEQNPSGFEDLRQQTGIQYKERHIASEPIPCMTETGSWTVNGIDLCNVWEIERLDYGTEVHNWTVRILDGTDNSTVTVRGRTLYIGKRNNLPPYILLTVEIIILLSLLAAWKFSRKNEYLVLAAIFLFLAIFGWAFLFQIGVSF